MKIKVIGLFLAAVLAAAGASFLGGAAQAADPSLQATEIWAAPSIAYDVNDSGAVAGYTGTWPDLRAAVWSPDGAISFLAMPDDATSSIAVAINSHGQVAGTLYLSGGNQEAVVWNSDGSISRLGFLPGGTFSTAQDINDSGWVPGVANAEGVYQGFLWRGAGTIEALPMPIGMTRAFADGINNEGAVVGEASGMFGPSVAVVWDGGIATALTPLADGATAAAADVSDTGLIVGNGATTAPPWLVRDPVLWDAGKVVDLGSLGGSFGLADAVNGNGQVVGYFGNAAGENHAFLWENGVRTLLDPLPGDTQSFAFSINGSGEIVGLSQPADGAGRAVRWAPLRDTTPPELTVTVSPRVLWPPNHKYVRVKTTVAATDDTDANPSIELVSVASNEPDNAPTDADGNTTNDIVKIDNYTFDLRAERNETGNGRIYTITYRATDASGNSTTQSVTIAVPVAK